MVVVEVEDAGGVVVTGVGGLEGSFLMMSCLVFVVFTVRWEAAALAYVRVEFWLRSLGLSW